MFYKGRDDSRYAVRTFVFTSIVPIDFAWSKGSGSVPIPTKWTNSYHSTNFGVILHMSVVYTSCNFYVIFYLIMDKTTLEEKYMKIIKTCTTVTGI